MMVTVEFDADDTATTTGQQFEGDAASAGEEIQSLGSLKVDVLGEHIEDVLLGKVRCRSRLETPWDIEVSSLIFSSNDAHEIVFRESSVSTPFNDERHQVVGQPFNLGGGSLVEFHSRVADIDLLQILFQFVSEQLLVGYFAREVQLIVEHIHPQLFPDVDDEVEGIVGMACLEGVAELEAVLLEGKQTELAIVEGGVEFVEVASETALVLMAPDGCQGMDELCVVVTVSDDAIQVFVHREEAHRLQVGQHIEEHLPRLLSRGKGIGVEVVDGLLLKLLNGNEHRQRVEHHLYPFDICRWQGSRLQGLPQVGSHRDAAFHHVRLMMERMLLVGRVG